MFSIIIPIYTPYSQFILQCINSVQKQTYANFECILVVPSSQKDEFDSLNLFLDRRFRVCFSISTSQSVNRNIGIKNAKNNYIIFIDCDDTIDSHFLELSKSIIETYNKDFVLYNICREEEKLGINSTPNIRIIDSKLDIQNLFYKFASTTPIESKVNIDTSCCKVYKKSILLDNNIFFDESTTCAEDFLFVRDYSICCKNILIVDNYNSYCWRKNPKSSMNTLGPFFDLNNFFKHFHNSLTLLQVINENKLISWEKYIINFRIRSLLDLYKKKAVNILKIHKFLVITYSANSYF